MVDEDEDGEDEWEETSAYLRNVANKGKRSKSNGNAAPQKQGGGPLANNDLMKKLRAHDFKLDLQTKENQK